MTSNDDLQLEEAPAVLDNSGLPAEGKVKLLKPLPCKKKAPLEETDFKVLVKLVGERPSIDRPGVDIVTVLDVSESMQKDGKLTKLKQAMQFLIQKLNPIDRLSIVSFSTVSTMLCNLRQVTETFKQKLQDLVDGLVAKGRTDIAVGLETALQVLNNRQSSQGRVSVIMLMSDGFHSEKDSDPYKIEIGKSITVHTFGFGKSYDPKVMDAIAKKSEGGVFSFVNVEKLGEAFAQILGGLLTVVAQDLEIKIKPKKGSSDKLQSQLAEIQDEDIPIGYKYERDANDGSVTIKLGDLYAQEIRRFLIKLRLLKHSVAGPFTILEVTGTYCLKGKSGIQMRGVNVQVTRDKDGALEPENKEVKAEEDRLEMMKATASAMETVKTNPKKAREDLVKFQNHLEGNKKAAEKLASNDESYMEIIKMTGTLIVEVRVLKDNMRNIRLYNAKGLAFGLATMTSHEKQRFAARIDPQLESEASTLRLFATPRMDVYLEQAKAFKKNPEKPLPTAEDDAKQELTVDPMAPFAGAIELYLDAAIQALQSIRQLLIKPPSSSSLNLLPST